MWTWEDVAGSGSLVLMPTYWQLIMMGSARLRPAAGWASPARPAVGGERIEMVPGRPAAAGVSATGPGVSNMSAA